MEVLVVLFWMAGSLACATACTLITRRGNKGDEVGWFILGLLFGVFALCAILLFPSSHQGERRCTACLSWVPGQATACRHCGERL